MDITVLYNLSYGLYVVGAMDGSRPVGCIINTCFQVTSQNPILAVSLNKNNYTLEVIKRTKRFSLSIITEDTNTNIISCFGFQCSKMADKYAEFCYDMVDEVPVVRGNFGGRLILNVINMVDNETHYVVLARLIDTVKGEGHPMTYEYYHNVVKGKAPKNAPTYRGEEKVADAVKAGPKKKRYVCSICGYTYEGDELPEGFVCPLCGATADRFKLVE
jgi:flavin reductase (DIM6/NTAB) family NADH-FMN oxidoreductase RutF/rubredoxin